MIPNPRRPQQHAPDVDALIAEVRSTLPVADPVAPRLRITEILGRIQSELAQRQASGKGVMEVEEGGTPEGVSGHFRPWRNAALPDTNRREFRLGELLLPTDESFVEIAYRSLLRREPDKAGLDHYLGQLRSGRLSKVEVLGDLRWSDEGRSRSVHVDGLLVPYTVRRWQRKPLIGPVLAWARALLSLGRLSEHHEAASGAAARDARALGTAINELASVAELRLSNLETKAEQDLKAMDATLAGLSSALDDSGSAISQIRTLLDEVERSSSDRVGALEARLATAATKDDLERIASDIRRRVAEAKEEAQTHAQGALQRATEEINGLGRKLGELVRRSENESSEAKSRLAALWAKVESLSGAHATLLARLAPMQAHLETLVPFPSVVVAAQKSINVLAQQQAKIDSAVNSLNAAGSDTKQLHVKLRTDLEVLRVSLEEGKSKILSHEERLASHEEILGEHKASLHGHGAVLSLAEQAKTKEVENTRALDPLYAAFEDQFRGDPRLIRVRVEPYLSIVTDAGMGTAETPVLDLGCGRGEWLELIRENGLVGRGIDNNQVFVQICRGRGLDVMEGDVIQAMAELPAMSIGAITGMHIAEHLPFEVLVRLLDEARRLLVRGGILVLETPNPENLQVATKLFYMDPTHRNPLPPEALKWLISARGFEDARIERWTIARDMEAPPLLDASVAGAESINVLLAQMAVAPDYSIIARRGGA